MDPIRPIGPPERDLKPVVRVSRSSPDAEQDHPDPRDAAPPRKQPGEDPQPPPDPDDGGSLIDVRV